MSACDPSCSSGSCCEADQNERCKESDVDGEIREAEKILNAFLCYGLYGREMACRTMMSFKKLSPTHKEIILKSHNEHMRNVLKCVDHNQEILKKIISYGLSVFGEEFATKTRRIRQKRRPDPHYMSKVLSVLRQIVREWTTEGKPERDATYKPLLDIVRERYSSTSERSSIKIMVPGSGLGRLAFELAKEGFTVEGNEFSMVMLMTSSFLLNACFEPEEHVVYPYALDKSNSWSYEDQTRPVYFPDLGKSRNEAPPNFSMIAGDFLEITQSRSSHFDCVTTAWFIDTAKNIIDYIETIYKILKPGGIWLNVGPLTYHYEDMIEEVIRLSQFQI
ncbi:n2227-like protein [Ostertagia ostertagi]